MKKTLFCVCFAVAFLAFGAISCGDSEKMLEYTERHAEDPGEGDTDKTPGEGNISGIPTIKDFGIDVLQVVDVPVTGDPTGTVVTVTAADDIEWTVEIPEEDSWIKASVLTGTGSGTVTITVEPNLSDAREGTVTISTESEETEPKQASYTIVVNQLPDSEIPELTYDIVSSTGVMNPSVVEDNGRFYVLSTNMDIEGAANMGGLMMRTSEDLITFSFKGYVLTKAFEKAKAKLVEAYPDIDEANIKMASPDIVRVNGQWRLYYTVYVHSTSASVIGYATSPSLEDQEWIDRGIILQSGNTGVRAAHPSFVEYDNRHFLVYGFGGINMLELNKTTGKPFGAVITLADDGVAGDAQIRFINGGYYLFLTLFEDGTDANIRILKSASGAATGPYVNHAGMNPWIYEDGFVVPNIIDANPAYLGYRYNGGPALIQQNGKWFILHHAQKGTSNANSVGDGTFRLHVRQVGILPESGWPTASLELYAGESQAITGADIAGTWGYTTLWYWIDWAGTSGLYSHRPDLKMYLHADGTMTGIDGTWTFDPASNQLRMVSDTWGGEILALTVSKADNSDDLDGSGLPVRFSAHGYNHTFGGHPAVIMRKLSNELP